MRTPHIAVGPTTPSWFRPSVDRQPTRPFPEWVPWPGGRRDIYGGNFLMLPLGTAYGLARPGFHPDEGANEQRLFPGSALRPAIRPAQ